ncbi:uncharacterized protein Z520_07470 [Fonsecaea multimorphosa CBS 102226]|uniref:Conserved oligomeric Golgi complex subunit 1 n=1 Tax=Fonsecaea multimorphosa CBS 102226 TaxID=1442371 RepID=A0A0D2H4H8_9EURO|nr:uncharacterized protein Z520_07470 [Fonsecaea multimorphosa CBS 102226]KIX96750.1 hypothetical protein Z520_07470 [Fonsecaea multimorphosa CBS 102226]OAL22431.1 hypothetical protein AYO22_06989 [Fonsecaea multimorphosa]
MDPSATIINWQHAFENHRIPQTRVIEKQLRASAAQNKDKLRALVGGSYRELLATAEAIVVLDAQTRSAEDSLVSISHNCRPLQQDASPRPPPADKVALAQFRLLQRCCSTAASSLRDHHILQCAQLMVVSRLLLKSLGDQDTLTRSLDSLRNRLGALRRQLLLRIEARLTNPTSTLSDLLESMCAYCLVTSSSSEDALAHLRQLRLEKIRRQLAASRQRPTICHALRYQIVSLQTFKSLIGRPMIDSINHLQKRPILEDPSIRGLEPLGLDQTFLLIPDEIRSFVPYFKRSAPTFEETQGKLETWSRECLRTFSDSLHHYLASVDQIAEVLELRQELYTTLLPSYFSTPAGSDIKDQISQALNKRLHDICHNRSARLAHITTVLLDKLATSRTTKSLWDSELALSNLDAGGAQLITRVRKRHEGSNVALSKASKSLNTWITTTNNAFDQLDEIAKIRWRDIVEEPDEENEDEASDLIRELCEMDSRLYRNSLQDTLQKALLEYEASITQRAIQVVDEPKTVLHVVALLRAIRVSMTSLQHAFPQQARFTKLPEIVHKLHQLVAEEVSVQLAASREGKKKPMGWNKDMLPDSMPSPCAFSTLRQLCKIMLEIGGTDLWSLPVVELVKEAVRSHIFRSESKVWYVENEFDEAYLSIALGRDTSTLPEEKANIKSASEYWARTKSLFGVLA